MSPKLNGSEGCLEPLGISHSNLQEKTIEMTIFFVQC